MSKPAIAHPARPEGKLARSLTIKSILLISLWAGLLTGMMEALIQIYRKLGLHQIIRSGPDIIWMAPLADALIFLSVGLLFIPYTRRFARVNNIKVLVFILAFLGAFSVIQYLPIHWLARDILTLGVAVTCANTIKTHESQFHFLVHKTIKIFVSVVILSGIGLHLYLGFVEGQALARLPTADPYAPNILMIVMDTVRAENLSVYGYERDTTPVLRRLAQKGVLFEQAFSTAPWTLPSHASMFTGRWPHELTADWEIYLDDTYPTLAEVLQEHGYQTAAFIGNHVYVSYEHGLNRGFIHFEDYVVSAGQLFVSSAIGGNLACWGEPYNGCTLRKLINFYQIVGRKNAERINRDTLSWFARRQSKPYFVFINYFDAHGPYLPPEPFDSSFDPKRSPLSKVYVGGYEAWNGTPEETQREENAYDESILYIDHQIGELLAQLQAQGQLENTLIIIASDHGEEFQEHGVMGHSNSLYRPSVQVPLLMVYPGQLPAGEHVDAPVSLRNIPATVLDLLGLAGSSPFPGYTLTNYLEDSGNQALENHDIILNEASKTGWRPSFYPIYQGDMKALVADGLRYIRNGDGSEELYDFDLDPQELNDLAATPAGQAQLPHYRLLLKNTFAQSQAK